MAEEAAVARQKGADVVIAILHWGREYRTRPDDTEVEFAQGSEDYPGLLAPGVDVILGSHPHVCQPIVHVAERRGRGSQERLRGLLLGQLRLGDGGTAHPRGVIVYVHIRKTGSEVEVTGLSYMGVYVQNYGPYPRKVRILPVLPGLDLGEECG